MSDQEYEKSGYVIKYRLELHDPPSKNSKSTWEDKWYFFVTIADNIDNTSGVEMRLPRNTTLSRVDYHDDGDALAISYSSVQQAMIATLKDALLHNLEITVYYKEYNVENDPFAYPVTKWKCITKVEIHNKV